MTTLHVHTRNSLYRIIISAGDAVLVEGGEFFPALTPAHFSGASVGGSFLKVGWIGIGLRMEILVDGLQAIILPCAFSVGAPHDVDCSTSGKAAPIFIAVAIVMPRILPRRYTERMVGPPSACA